MADQSTQVGQDPTSEVLATSGLVTMLGSVMTAVMAIVSFGQGSMATTGVLAVVAVVCFAVSVGCFFSDSNRSDTASLPFPSWLRADGQ